MIKEGMEKQVPMTIALTKCFSIKLHFPRLNNSCRIIIIGNKKTYHDPANYVQ
jgi:hypothetical protein